LTPEILAAQTLGSTLFEPRASWQDEQGFVACKWSPHGRLFDGPEPKTLHVTAFAGPARLSEAASRAATLGADKLRIGADHNHVMPGIPLSQEGGLDLAPYGFERTGGYACDLERDLAGYEPYPGCLEALEAQGFRVRPSGPEDEMALDEFLAESFPGRWRFDVMRKFRQAEERQIDILVKDGGVFGFSSTQNASTQHLLGGAVWSPSLGGNWASLGPIGVSSKVRGLKLGGALLGASLLRLSQEGARQTIIDWTTLVDFYGMHGFLVTREYQGWQKLL
jgi:predicted N-acetyltransferase YhbS